MDFDNALLYIFLPCYTFQLQQQAAKVEELHKLGNHDEVILVCDRTIGFDVRKGFTYGHMLDYWMAHKLSFKNYGNTTYGDEDPDPPQEQ